MKTTKKTPIEQFNTLNTCPSHRNASNELPIIAREYITTSSSLHYSAPQNRTSPTRDRGGLQPPMEQDGTEWITFATDPSNFSAMVRETGNRMFQLPAGPNVQSIAIYARQKCIPRSVRG